MPANQTSLYLVYLRDGAPLEPAEFAGLRKLDEGLYLLRTAQTRSKVYHSIKRAAGPEGLLVAPLADRPKFKGMEEGALKWMRSPDIGSA